MATADTLESLMSRGYSAIAMGRGDLSEIIADFNEAANEDDGLKPAATQALYALSSAQAQRCFVSRTRADFLRRVLNP